MKAIVIVTTALMLVLVSCQSAPSPPDTPNVQSSEKSTDELVETPTVASVQEMIEPTVALPTTEVSSDSVQVVPLPRSSDCPQLESRLYDLMVVENPDDAAKIMGLFYQDGATRALVQLDESAGDMSFVTEYGAQIETQTDGLVQVLVPVANLCDLSNDSRVKFVRSPQTVMLP